jgi:hypothetical protein
MATHDNVVVSLLLYKFLKGHLHLPEIDNIHSSKGRFHTHMLMIIFDLSRTFSA